MSYLITTNAELDTLAAAEPNTVVSFVDSLGITHGTCAENLAENTPPWDTWPVTVHAHRVITGTVEQVEAALDALPQWSIVRVGYGDDDPLTYEKIDGVLAWYETGRTRPVSSETIARHHLPVTVVCEGGSDA